MTAIQPRETWPTIEPPTGLHLHRLHLTRKAAEMGERSIHATLERVWDGHGGRLLWSHPEARLVIVQAPGRPDPVLLHAHTATTAAIHHQAGARVEIAGICNPTSKHGHRRTPVPAGQLADWLAARLDGAVSLDSVAAEPLHPLVLTKAGHRVALSRAGYAALGRVIDSKKLAHALTAGVGHGKAYGLGLLLATEVSA